MKRVSKVTEVLNYTLSHIMSLSRRELAKVTSLLASAANKRLKRFKQKKITTPATEYIKKHGGKFSVKGKNVYQLREEFQRAKGFLESETSTLKGYRSWERKMVDTLKKNSGIDYNSLTETQKRKFWKAYSKLEELDSANVYGARYRTSVNEIYTAVKGGLKQRDIDSFVESMNDKIYKESTKNLFTGVNDPFNVVENPFQ